MALFSKVIPDTEFYNSILTNSCLFDVSSSSSLSRTVSTPDSSKIVTMSVWCKRSTISNANRSTLMYAGNVGATGNLMSLEFTSTDALRLLMTGGGTGITTNAVFRDCSGWYHIVAALDTTQVTNTDRQRLWVNGIEITDFSSATYLAQDATINYSRQFVGSLIGIREFDGYLSDVYVLDGIVATASDFGESKNGIWIPKTYTGSYGTEGFHLNFETNTHFGDDVSGNINDLTDSGMGTDHQVTDTPENNYCTLDWNNGYHNATYPLVEGGLRHKNAAATWLTAAGTFLMKSGKWYWELDIGSDTLYNYIGIAAAGESSGDWILKSGGTLLASYTQTYLMMNHYSVWEVYDAGRVSISPNTLAADDVIGIAFDADNNKIWFSLNGTWINKNSEGTGVPSTGTNPTFDSADGIDADLYDYVPALDTHSNITNLFNFGQRTFAYTPPTGFNALCTENLSTPATIDPQTAIDVLLYTGNGSNPRTITGLDFQPDFVWIKNRDNTYNHTLSDSTRGADSNLSTNSTSVESNQPVNGYIHSFESNGFSVDTGITSDGNINNSGDTYVAWCLKKGSTYGFDIVTYAGTGASQAINHSLGVIPELIIVKERTNDAGGWVTFHKAALNKTDPETDFGTLNTTNTWADLNTMWNDTTPTTTQFTVGSHDDISGSGDTYVAYLWASVNGFSKVFSFEGNGNAAGPYVYCGFRPRWILWKNVDAVESWNLRDILRNSYNPVTNALWPNLTTAESTTGIDIDINANGFKCRHASFVNNNTYIGIAFSDQPFKYSNAR